MESGLDLLGASDAFADQYITVRIKDINRELLKQKIGGSTGSIASSALSIIDSAPKAVLDLVIPLAKKEALGYGIDADVTVSNVPPSKGGRAFSEFWPGVLVGGVLGGMSLLLVHGIRRLAGKE